MKTGQTAIVSLDNSKGLIEHAMRTLQGVPNGAPVALSRAINRATEGMRTDITKTVTEQYAVRAGDVRATMKLVRANPSRLEASVHIEGPRIPLIRFKTSPTKPPKTKIPTTRVMTSRAGGFQGYKGAFVQRMDSGHVGVFHRRGEKRIMKSGSAAGKERQPIAEWYGPSIAEMSGAPSITQVIEQGAYSRMEKTLDHEIGRMLRGAM